MFCHLFRSFLLATVLGTVLAGPCRPADPEHPLRGGDFEGKNPFQFSGDSQVGGSLVSPGYESEHKFYSFTMVDNDLLEMYHDVTTVGGAEYECTYNWYFDHYYATLYDDDEYYVPYLRFYFNNERVGNRYPTGPEQTGRWMSGSFTFTSSEAGKDRIWIDAASPQSRYGDEGGENNLSIDNIVCSIVRTGNAT